MGFIDVCEGGSDVLFKCVGFKVVVFRGEKGKLI